MAKFIKVVEESTNGRKYITYINLANVAYICALDIHGTAIRFIGQDDDVRFDMAISDFMDLVNSAK